MAKPGFYFESGELLGGALQRGLQWLGVESRITATSRIVIKPNLTFPVFRKGVMTRPEAIGSVVRYLRELTPNITICESDSGGYNRFSMDEVFVRTGLRSLAEELDISIINLSHSSSREIRVTTALRTLPVPLPRLILDDCDLFITMPVPKVHSNAIVSLALKNQWGIIQQPELRLKLHPYFADVVYHITKSLPASVAILDGKFGLTRNGPMCGDEIELNWIAMSDNLFVHDFVVAGMMGIGYQRVPYLQKILRRERIRSLDQVAINTNDLPVDERFYLERAWTDYPGLFTFRSRALAYLGYESFLSKPLHRLLYKFREPFY